MSKKEIRSKMDFWLNHHGSFSKERGMELTDLAVHVRQSLPHLGNVSFSEFLSVIKNISSKSFKIEDSVVWLSSPGGLVSPKEFTVQMAVPQYGSNWPDIDFLKGNFSVFVSDTKEETGSYQYASLFVDLMEAVRIKKKTFQFAKKRLFNKQPSEELGDFAIGLGKLLFNNFF